MPDCLAGLSAPRSPVVIPGNSSLRVEWKPPETSVTCLKHYRVNVESNNSTFNTTWTNITIPHLHACMTYQVHLTAVNEDGEDGDAVTVNGETRDYSKCAMNGVSISDNIRA